MHHLVIKLIFIFVVDATAAQHAVRPAVSTTRFGQFTPLLLTQKTLAIARLALQCVRVLFRFGWTVQTVLSLAVVGAAALGAAGMFSRKVGICVGRLRSITTGSLAVSLPGAFSIGLPHAVCLTFTVPTTLAFGITIPTAVPVPTTTFTVPAALALLLTVTGSHTSADPTGEITSALF
jgi:hypothetical protein